MQLNWPKNKQSTHSILIVDTTTLCQKISLWQTQDLQRSSECYTHQSHKPRIPHKAHKAQTKHTKHTPKHTQKRTRKHTQKHKAQSTKYKARPHGPFPSMILPGPYLFFKVILLPAAFFLPNVSVFVIALSISLIRFVLEHGGEGSALSQAYHAATRAVKQWFDEHHDSGDSNSMTAEAMGVAARRGSSSSSSSSTEDGGKLVSWEHSMATKQKKAWEEKRAAEHEAQHAKAYKKSDAYFLFKKWKHMEAARDSLPPTPPPTLTPTIPFVSFHWDDGTEAAGTAAALLPTPAPRPIASAAEASADFFKPDAAVPTPAPTVSPTLHLCERVVTKVLPHLSLSQTDRLI